MEGQPPVSIDAASSSVSGLVPVGSALLILCSFFTVRWNGILSLFSPQELVLALRIDPSLASALAKCPWGGSALEGSSLGKENTASGFVNVPPPPPPRFSLLPRIQAACKSLVQNCCDVFITVVMDKGIVAPH